MQCPRGDGELRQDSVKGIEVERCAACQGIWLDREELDALEDKEMEDDPAKGSLMFRSFAGDLACPHCQSQLQAFNYRANNLELDFCPNEHGWWLDHGEEERVLELMRQRAKDMKRKASAEQQWASFLRSTKNPSFMDKMKGLFRR